MADQNESYFFNLHQQNPVQDAPRSRNGVGDAGGTSSNPNSQTADDNNYIPRPKRIACVVCRKRKLRCDGKKPSCGTCARLGHNCAYDEVRKKSGPKRGYVKQLEARLAQVETLLKSQEPEILRNATSQQQCNNAFTTSTSNDLVQAIPDISPLSSNLEDNLDPLPGIFTHPHRRVPDPHLGFDGEFSWEMISLGLEEPLPTQDVIDELHQIFFETIYPTIPMIHRPRYLAAVNLAPNMRPPICLRYIIWCLAAHASSKYSFLQDHFYARARKYAQMDEVKGHGEAAISVAHCQCWLLVSLYEFKVMHFPRAWISTGKAARLAQMMGMDRLDCAGLDTKQCVPSPRDWTDREERRRTFWMAFCQDRYASMGTGWAMLFDERDISTNLPANEEAFVNSNPQQTQSLSETLASKGIANLTPVAGVILVACLFGRNLTHLHRPSPQENDHDLNGDFWKRHRNYAHILRFISTSLPIHLRLPQAINDPNTVFCNMGIHTSTICLHQAAIVKAKKSRVSSQVLEDSKARCIVAANQIAKIMRMISHTDLSRVNPYTSFCLFAGARVFVEFLKADPDDQMIRSSLQFILGALGVLKSFSLVTESFLNQLDVELQETGIVIPSCVSSDLSYPIAISRHDNAECTPLLAFRQSQSAGVVVESPLRNKTCFETSESSYNGQPGQQILPRLPNRQKQSESQRPSTCNSRGHPCISHGLSSSSDKLSPRTDESGMWATMDELSPDISVSDHHISASDNASPATMNSSSNASFTPPKLDQSLPQSQQTCNDQGSSCEFAAASIAILNPKIENLSTSMTSFDQYLSTSTGAPQDPASMEATFAMTAGWEYQTSHPFIENVNTIVRSDMDTFSDSQWAQILENRSWESWRT